MKVNRLALLLVCLPTLAACGIDGASKEEPAAVTVSASPGSAIAALVPPDIKSKGSFTVVTDVTYPPFGMLEKDGKTMAGIDIDTVNALKPVLGVDIKVVNASFDAFIPGLQAKRYDAGFNAISDTPDRRKVLDFINFNQFGGVFLTKPDSTLAITELKSACGVTVGAEKGADTIDLLQSLAPLCKADGKPAVDLKVFGTESDALTALTSGRVQAVLSGGTTGAYKAERSNGKYKVNGPLLGNLKGDFDRGGLALPKGSALTEAMLAAMKQLYTDGTLTSIYAKYGIAADNLIEPGLNSAG